MIRFNISWFSVEKSLSKPVDSLSAQSKHLSSNIVTPISHNIVNATLEKPREPTPTLVSDRPLQRTRRFQNGVWLCLLCVVHQCSIVFLVVQKIDLSFLIFPSGFTPGLPNSLKTAQTVRKRAQIQKAFLTAVQKQTKARRCRWVRKTKINSHFYVKLLLFITDINMRK